MDRSPATTRDRSAFWPRARSPDCAFGVCDHAQRPHRDRDPDVGGRDLAASEQGSFRRQHAALADMVRAVEPDFADQLAERLLAQYGSLNALLCEPLRDLILATGNAALATILSTAKAVVVESLFAELPKTSFSPTDQNVLRYVSAIMGGLTHEEAHVFFLDRRLRFLRHEVFAYGSESETSFPMQMIFRRALQIGSSQLVLIHNHPAGSPQPSQTDIDFTRRAVDAGQAIGLDIHDHLVVAGPRVYSFRSAGLL
jgi:DNA repair protein RadC